MSTRFIVNAVLLVLLLFFAYAGQTILKIGLSRVGAFQPDSTAAVLEFYTSCLTNPWVWMGGVVVAAGFALWLAFLSRMDISQALPTLALSYIPWLIIGRVFFNEPVGLVRIFGVLLITGGVFFTNWRP